MGVCDQRHSSSALPSRKGPVTPCPGNCVDPSRSERVRKISLPAGFDPGTVEAVASRYNNYAISATLHTECMREVIVKPTENV